MKILAFDIGGTFVKYGLKQDGQITFGQFPVSDADGNENIPQSICLFSKKSMPDSIAISSPGPFDFETGTSHITHKLLSMHNVSLRDELKKEIPHAEVIFTHDLTAFAVGVLKQKPELKKKNIAVITLGTGLGYTVVNKGKVLLNKKQSPRHSLWNRPFIDGISEDYVSTGALLCNSRKCGYEAENVLDMALTARNGNEKILNVFYEYGRNLGSCVMNANETDEFSEIVIGGQISLSFDLIREGFESTCGIKYSVADEPEKCAVYGLLECAECGKEKYCICEV